MLARKLALLVLLPLLVFVVGAEVAAYVVTAKKLRAQADQELEGAVAALSTAISERLEGVRDDAGVLASDLTLDEYFRNLEFARTGLAHQQLLRLEDDYARIAGLKPACRAFRLFHSDGRARISIVDGERDYRAFSAAGTPWFEAALAAADDETGVSRVIASDDPTAATVMVWRPVRVAGRVRGVIAIEVRVADLAVDLLPSVRAASRGYVYVVEPSGRVAASDPPGSIAGDVAGEESTRRLAAGESGALSTTGPDGEPVRVAYVLHRESGLGIVLAVPHTTIFAPVEEVRNTVLFVTIVAFTIVLVVGLVLVRRRVEPLRQLTDGARRVARGEFDLTLDVNTGDEIEELAESFTQMTRSLRDAQHELEAALAAEGQRAAELEEAYENLKETQRQLAQAEKMGLLGQLAGGVAHDFNNLLGGILGSADLLQRKRGSPEEQQRYVELIRETANRAADLVNQLLAFARPGPANRVVVDVESVVTEAVGILQRTVDRRVEIRCRMAATRSVVEADAAELQSAVLNLGINARDAIDGAGTITFTTLVAELDDATCTRLSPPVEAGTYVEIGVADDGVGMTRDVVARIFEPFFTTKSVGKGTGLGLAAVYGTVRRHGGTVSVYSEPGRGTQFKLYLPLAKGSTPALAESGQDVLRGTGRVLLVDDEPVIREIGSEMLRAIGYEVDVAENGEDALRMYRADPHSFDLVLSDLVMPGMNGTELLRALRREDPGVAVLIASGFHLDTGADDLKRDGARGFLSKPFVMANLSHAVAAAMAPPPGEDRKPARVLVVDDSALNRGVMVALLEELGHSVVSVESGERAIVAVGNHGFDVVLMDVELPGMDGCEAARAIHDGGHALPIVAVTGDTSVQQQERCLAAGMTEVRRKPASLDEMQEAVARHGRPVTRAPRSRKRIAALLATAFVEEIPKLLDELHAAIDAGDVEALRRVAHTLHGSLRHFRAKDAMALSDQLQAQQAPDDARELAARLDAACRSLADTLGADPVH